MPDHSSSYSEVRISELKRSMSGAPEYSMRTNTSRLVKKEKFPSVIDTLNDLSMLPSPDAKGCHADRGYNTDMIGTEAAVFQGQSPKKSRAKESSIYFGVRFRPDLQKWVAEIRVAEWKSVDKKVWLGTFDSEEGAARAVDAARKLLQCKKKRLPNFPCESLNTYSEKIPANLNLNNLRDDCMFKEVTLFVKRKAQEYAASFCHNKPVCISITSDQVLANMNSALPNLPQEFAMQEESMSIGSYSTSYGSSSYNSYNTQLGVIAGDCQWMSSPTSIPKSYGSTPSSAGTSPEGQHSWYVVDNVCYDYGQEMPQVEETSVEGGWTALHLQSASHSSHDAIGNRVWEGTQSLGSDGQYVLTETDQWLTEVNDFLFPYDDENFQAQTTMDIVPVDEMLYEESQNQAYNGDPSLVDWVHQQNLNSYHSLMDYSIQTVC